MEHTKYDVCVEIECSPPISGGLEMCLKEIRAEVAQYASGEQIWRINSGESREAPLAAHLSYLIERVGNICPELRNEISRKGFVNIGVFFYSAECSIDIDGNSLKSLLELLPGIALRAVCYPCSREGGGGEIVHN